jgi:putative oxygen-independent coproporphyrinogen III oxidase
VKAREHGGEPAVSTLPAAADSARRLAIYIHWPFCASKCPYCDFNSHVAAKIDHGRWQRALLQELDHFAVQTGGRIVTSIFFGGGTPSLMPPGVAAALIEAVRTHWPVAEDLEVTLEANPSSAEASRFAALRDAGVNRLSIGLQSLDDTVLKFLGRAHSAAEARAAVEAAAASFARFSFDLIYGWGGHTTYRWRRDLADAIELAGEHLSAYQLTIEPGTAFHRARTPTAGEDTMADLYEATTDTLATAGLAAYEISNYARPGAACRHNLAIWQGIDYVGIGPGAHGRLTRDFTCHALQQHRLPDRWLKTVESQGHGTARQTPLGNIERREELLLLGLRLADGIERSRFRALTGFEVDQAVDANGLARVLDWGLVILDGQGLRVTPSGQLLLDAVLRELLVRDPPAPPAEPRLKV